MAITQTTPPNQVSTLTSPLSLVGPPIADREFLDQVSMVRNSLTLHGQHITLNRDIAPTARSRMQLRLRELNLWTSPQKINKSAHAIAIAEMLQCYPSLARADAKAMTAKFVSEVADLPTWAVERACVAVRRGDADCSLDFPPATPRLRAIVLRYVQPVWAEQIELHKLLAAEVETRPPPAERERVTKGFQQLGELLRK